MLERIHWVKGIGLLHNSDARAYGLKKASLIYSDNGRGKSTLASIIRSCSTSNPGLVLNRQTIGGVNNPEVLLQFSNGKQTAFQYGSWNHQHPELLVFDADFVDQNVYAGGQVTTDQRKNLLQFALGSNAVVAQHEYDQADLNARTTAATVRDLTGQLSAIHRGMNLAQFQELVEVPDADNQILALNAQIVEAQSIGRIQGKALPQKLDIPNLDVEPLFNTFSLSLANIDLAAEERVKNHLQTQNKSGLEKWISDGHAYGEQDTCLFCDQPLAGVELIQAYRSYFNQDYNQLKASVAQLDRQISTACSDSIIDRLAGNFATASAVVNGWQEHLDLPPPEFDEATARNALGEIRGELEKLKHSKELRLLDAIGTEADKNHLMEKWQLIVNIIENCNRYIASAEQLIADYKNNLAAVNAETLQQQINTLEWAKLRYRPDVVNLLTQLTDAQSQNDNAQALKQTKRDALNQIMQVTLGNYKDRINELLRSFGAQFTISNIDFNYLGGLRSDYVLQMRGSNISLSGGVPDFKTSLSESDKRTLAFAFFVASIESIPDLANKIIVIDDPMCSLDLNRKHQTRTVLKRLHDRSHQLIVLAHDIDFIRNMRDDILRTAQPNDVKCIRLKAVADNYSDFDDIDIDKECESSYFKCHRMLNEYISGNAANSIEVARSIRPMLEGYLHRRFPKLIPNGLLFGQVVRLIDQAQIPSPLVHAQNITNELNEINLYAGQFHHDTNPAADQVQVVDGELRGFVERAINVVHAGAI